MHISNRFYLCNCWIRYFLFLRITIGYWYIIYIISSDFLFKFLWAWIGVDDTNLILLKAMLFCLWLQSQLNNTIGPEMPISIIDCSDTFWLHFLFYLTFASAAVCYFNLYNFSSSVFFLKAKFFLCKLPIFYHPLIQVLPSVFKKNFSVTK